MAKSRLSKGFCNKSGISSATKAVLSVTRQVGRMIGLLQDLITILRWGVIGSLTRERRNL